MANSLPVSRAVSVSLSMSPIAAAGRDFGAVLVIGTSSVIPVSERIREYGTYEEILEDFGASAPETLAANAFFSQEPKPSQLFIGRWVKAGAAAAALGAIIPEANQDVSKFTGISSGSPSLKIDGGRLPGWIFQKQQTTTRLPALSERLLGLMAPAPGMAHVSE